MTGKENIQQRQDIAKTKRVELSAHTKMGPMDSVVSVKELIRTAESWGWDAIAITDHGGVQAFPDAMDTVFFDRLNIKIIYGMEGNLTGDDYKQPHANRVTILVQDMHGKNNLYRLVSKSHLYFTYGQEPRIPRRILEEHRHGLLLGSSGADGELIRAIATRQYDDEELITVARFYDYLEIQPIGNYVSLLRSDEFPNINTKEDLRDINRKVVELGKKLNKLVVATGDIRFLNPENAICWEVIMANRESEESEGNEIEAQACQKVKYLFPRAHAVSYVMMAYRIAYYKVHYPAAFYAAYFSIHAQKVAYDVDAIEAGVTDVKKRILMWYKNS